jgi:prolyl-tRNA synthetase
MGALIMTHSDDQGLVLPPKLAPIQVVIVPIYKNPEQLDQIASYAKQLISELVGIGISVKFDDDDNKKPGWKFAEYEMKGVPLRIAIGPRDIENKTVELARRDDLSKTTLSQRDLSQKISKLLEQIQEDLFRKSSDFLKDNITFASTVEEMNDILNSKSGFVEAFWNGDSETEQKIKDITKATIRCIPLEEKSTGKCIISGDLNSKKVLFARAY